VNTRDEKLSYLWDLLPHETRAAIASGDEPHLPQLAGTVWADSLAAFFEYVRTRATHEGLV